MGKIAAHAPQRPPLARLRTPHREHVPCGGGPGNNGYSAVATHIGNVDELFDLKHGLVVVVDQPIAQIPIPVRIGDAVEFRTTSGTALASSVRGIEHANPWTEKRFFAFLLPREIVRSEVPLRSEVWVVGRAAAE